MTEPSKKEAMERRDPLVQEVARELGKNVRALRKDQKLSQERLGYMIGTGHSRISNIERGLVVIRLSDIVKLAEALGVRLEEIIDLSAFDPVERPAADPAGHAQL